MKESSERYSLCGPWGTRMTRHRLFPTLPLLLIFAVAACAPAPAKFAIQIIAVTSPIEPGTDARLELETTPGAECEIEVRYASGPSTAQGLVPMQADENGRVMWTWRFGTNTTPGTGSVSTQRYPGSADS